MKRAALLGLAAALLLANNGMCVSNDAGVHVEPQIVYVPKPVAAVKRSDIPAVPCRGRGTDKETISACLGKAPDDARAGLALALAKLLEFVSYGDKADPLLQSAAKDPE